MPHIRPDCTVSQSADFAEALKEVLRWMANRLAVSFLSLVVAARAIRVIPLAARAVWSSGPLQPHA